MLTGYHHMGMTQVPPSSRDLPAGSGSSPEDRRMMVTLDITTYFLSTGNYQSSHLILQKTNAVFLFFRTHGWATLYLDAPVTNLWAQPNAFNLHMERAIQLERKKVGEYLEPDQQYFELLRPLFESLSK
jgi:hypothetical protein